MSFFQPHSPTAPAVTDPAPPGTGAILLEVDGRTAGIVTRTDGAFVFFASGRRFAALDQHSFRSIGQAERALQGLLRGRRSS